MQTPGARRNRGGLPAGYRRWSRPGSLIGEWFNTALGEGLALILALLAGAYVALLLAWGWVCRAVAYRPGGEREL